MGVSYGLLDPSTGGITCLSPFKMPATAGSWDFGSGTRGQTSANFPMNQTYFFVAQENFPNGTIGRTVLMQAYGPYGQPGQCSTGNSFVRAPLPTQRPLATLNTAWDHTCNIVVLIPAILGSNSHSIITKQVSEYDGQVRPQVDYLPPTSGAFWTKVDGLGALDFGDYHSSWPAGAELNCGDSCIFYTLEQSPVDGAPRALIGKSFRTGRLAANLTDSLQLQTLSWSPFGRWNSKTSQFLGIGVCCSASWCHPDCQGLAGHSVLVLFDSVAKKFSVLADIGDGADPDTFRLGVEFSGMFMKDKQAFIYNQGTIITYALTVDETTGAIQSATKSNTSPPVQQLHSWFAGRAF